jgi:transposase-like protein
MEMCDQERLWREFPKTRQEFDQRFATEADCARFIAEIRFPGGPVCPKCGCETMYTNGTRGWDCSRCRYRQTLTSGTVMHKTRKPLKWWFEAIWLVCVQRPGISAKDLQRILGFGSYETAWTWLHKIRRLMGDPERQVLENTTELDETLIKTGRPSEAGRRRGKCLVFVGVEAGGRVRLVHAENNDESTIRQISQRILSQKATVTTDGLASYNDRTLGEREHHQTVEYNRFREGDALQRAHWAASNLKRWLLGTHGGAVSAKHLQSYLHEHEFRYNRRKTHGVGRVMARALQNLTKVPPITLNSIINDTVPCRITAGVS